MVTLTGKKPLRGWKYPLYTMLHERKIVRELVRAGVKKELLRDATEPKPIKLFDFMANGEFATRGSYELGRITINIVTTIRQKKDGIGMNTPEVFTIHITRKRKGRTS